MIAPLELAAVTNEAVRDLELARTALADWGAGTRAPLHARLGALACLSSARETIDQLMAELEGR